MRILNLNGVWRHSHHAYPQPEWGSGGAAATLIVQPPRLSST